MNIKKAIQRITKAANNINKLKLKSITYVRLMALIAVLHRCYKGKNGKRIKTDLTKSPVLRF